MKTQTKSIMRLVPTVILLGLASVSAKEITSEAELRKYTGMQACLFQCAQLDWAPCGNGTAPGPDECIALPGGALPGTIGTHCNADYIFEFKEELNDDMCLPIFEISTCSVDSLNGCRIFEKFPCITWVHYTGGIPDATLCQEGAHGGYAGTERVGTRNEKGAGSDEC